MHEIERTIGAVRDLIEQGRRGILVTVIRTAGSTYRRSGARVVVDETGGRCGAISGGCIESDLAERIRPWLEAMEPLLVTYDSTREDDALFGLGLGCRGVLDLLVEPFSPSCPPRLLGFRWNGREAVAWRTELPDGRELLETVQPPRRMLLFGSGQDVEPVRRLAESVDWDVDVVTSRELPDCHGYDAAVVMTHNLERDAAILDAVLRGDVTYVGVLGPRSRGDEILARLGLARSERFHSPIGLDLGAETPEEIALSILSEVQMVLNRRGGRPLRDLDAAIHDAKADLVTCA